MAAVNGDDPSAADKESAGRAGNKSLYIDLWGKAKSFLPATGPFSLLLFFFPSPPGFSQCHPTATNSLKVVEGCILCC